MTQMETWQNINKSSLGGRLKLFFPLFLYILHFSISTHHLSNIKRKKAYMTTYFADLPWQLFFACDESVLSACEDQELRV